MPIKTLNVLSAPLPITGSVVALGTRLKVCDMSVPELTSKFSPKAKFCIPSTFRFRPTTKA